MEKYTEITELLIKHLRQELTPDESATLTAWVEQDERNSKFFSEINNMPGLMDDVRAYGKGRQIDLDAAWEKMKTLGWGEPVAEPAKIVRMPYIRYAAAAVVVLLVSVTAYFLLKADKPLPKAPVLVSKLHSDAKPGATHATLTLDNGQVIILDSVNSGLLATQGTTEIVRQQNGAISYAGGAKGDKLIYNKVTVPKGSDVVYLQLSDGSKVWLNAASSIRYPVVFNEEERKVEITGEAYFEVTRSKSKHFIVSKGNMNVEVLGTKFNVNAYDNEENIKITLLEGSVKVQSDKGEKIIKPGQQAVLTDARINVVNDVDIEQVMAWKEGKFVFNNTNIQLIMRQMERWYDLEPASFVSDTDKQWEFNGEISRYSNASKVLQLLEKTGSVKFTVDGKKIIVTHP